jgi:hypothetical protein
MPTKTQSHPTAATPDTTNNEKPADATLHTAITPDTTVNKKRAPVSKQNSSKTKTPKSEPRFFSFELRNQQSDENFENKEDADAFKEEFPELILKEHKFSNEKRFREYLLKRELKLKQLKTDDAATASSTKTNNDNKSSTANLLIKKMTALEPQYRFQVYYRTTPKSTSCVLIFRFLSKNGEDAWCWKPFNMLRLIQELLKIKKNCNSLIGDAFANMRLAEQPDPNDPTKPKVFMFSIPTKTDRIPLTMYSCYTILPIPHTEIKTVEAEVEWINQQSNEIFDTLCDSLKDEDFKSTFATLKPDFANKTYNPQKRGHLLEFLDSAKVNVQKIENLNAQLILSHASEAMQQLHKTRLQRNKYACNIADDSLA